MKCSGKLGGYDGVSVKLEFQIMVKAKLLLANIIWQKTQQKGATEKL